MVRPAAFFTRLAIVAAGRKVPQFVLVQNLPLFPSASLAHQTPHRPSMQVLSLVSLTLQNACLRVMISTRGLFSSSFALKIAGVSRS